MSVALGLIAGVLAGTTVGLLCAPQPGRETRAMIRQKTAGCVSALRGRSSQSSVAAPADSLG
jgi:gas vesicle protein